MTTATSPEVALSHLGVVPTSYVHEWREAEPEEPLVTPKAVFKWYHVRREGADVPAALDAEARTLVAEAVAGDTFDVSYGLNFALLHLSTRNAFLIVGVWKGHQEMWERIAVMDVGTSSPLQWQAFDPVDMPAACVWEMGVICHERMAWHRYLFSERTEADKQAWLADTYRGRV